MRSEQAKHLCLSLVKADSEDQVISLLKDVELWEDQGVWRYYGDYENNYNTIGNQQGRPDAALVEKLVNSVDATLMNECLRRSIQPDRPQAPKSIREAVAIFFEGAKPPISATAGQIRNWPGSKRLEMSKKITLAATGARAKEGDPSFTISDCGEGQTPEMMPSTFLSLTKSNKLRIPFVQGKFNMGGTGVLKFCGRHNLQLILSRRNPDLLDIHTCSDSDKAWGFTIVRREDPEGNRRSSVYTYLAPLDADIKPCKGQILWFNAPDLPIFPDGREAYVRASKSGTLIKLYEYSATGYSRSHILMKDGLLGRADLLLPDVALPIRFHECRAGYRGHEGSFATTLTGISVRLEEDKNENLEPDFPSSCQISAQGESMVATIYAFKKHRAETYRKNEGIIFTLNGQTHGQLTVDFFRRKNVGLSYLADSILVVVDCSQFSGRAREDLFMNSRDRLSGGELRKEIEQELEDMLKHHPGLRALKERRRREEVESRLEDNKPLENILSTLLQKYPVLSGLFLTGQRLTNPFKTHKVREEEKEFVGKRYPTYFKFKGKDSGIELKKECHINMRSRITFETDAVNDYLSRQEDPGKFSILRIMPESSPTVDNFSINLQNGIATLNLRLPETVVVGDELTIIVSVTDSARIEPITNTFQIKVKEAVEPSGGGTERRKPPSELHGNDRDVPSGIQLPNIKEVYESDWNNLQPPFDKYSAIRIKHAGILDENDNNSGKDVYDFFVNMDNVYLQNELKSAPSEALVDKTRFKLGLVLLALALLQYELTSQKTATSANKDDNEDSPGMNVEDKVEGFSKAVAPIILPMIDSLGVLETYEESTASSGEAV